MPRPIRNCLSVDLEASLHVANLQAAGIPHGALRVEPGTRRLLEIFQNHGLKATFFVLGEVAEPRPVLPAWRAFRQYHGIERLEERLERIFDEFRFGPVG